MKAKKNIRPDDTDVDESGSDESEREHPDGTDVEETDLGETEREEPDDTDVVQSYSRTVM